MLSWPKLASTPLSRDNPRRRPQAGQTTRVFAFQLIYSDKMQNEKIDQVMAAGGFWIIAFAFIFVALMQINPRAINPIGNLLIALVSIVLAIGFAIGAEYLRRMK